MLRVFLMSAGCNLLLEDTEVLDRHLSSMILAAGGHPAVYLLLMYNLVQQGRRFASITSLCSVIQRTREIRVSEVLQYIRSDYCRLLARPTKLANQQLLKTPTADQGVKDSPEIFIEKLAAMLNSEESGWLCNGDERLHLELMNAEDRQFDTPEKLVEALREARFTSWESSISEALILYVHLRCSKYARFSSGEEGREHPTLFGLTFLKEIIQMTQWAVRCFTLLLQLETAPSSPLGKAPLQINDTEGPSHAEDQRISLVNRQSILKALLVQAHENDLQVRLRVVSLLLAGATNFLFVFFCLGPLI